MHEIDVALICKALSDANKLQTVKMPAESEKNPNTAVARAVYPTI